MNNLRPSISLERLVSYYNSSGISLALLCVSPNVIRACESCNAIVGPWRVSVTRDGHRKLEWRSASTTCHSSVSDAIRLVSWWSNISCAGKSPALTFLDLSAAVCVARCPSDLRFIVNFGSLVGLTLSRGSIEDVNILGNLHTLKRVELIMLCISNSGIVGLSDSKSLQEVSLWGCSGITDINVLGKLPMLERLVLSETSVCDSGIIGLSKCKNLKELHIDACGSITAVGFLGKLPHLQKLSAVKASVQNDSIPGLGESHSLEYIDLWGCRDVRDVGPLADIPTLRQIDLSLTAVGNDSIASLGSSKSLEEIELVRCEAVSDVSLLACIPTLRRLSLNLSSILEEDVAETFPDYVTITI